MPRPPKPADVRQRYSYDCGPAAVRAACGAFGRRTPKVRCGRRDGTPTPNVEDALRRARLLPSPDLADLRHHLRRGRLVLCAVPVDHDDHWVVVYSAGRRWVKLHDPSSGPCQKSVSEFLTLWTKAGRVAVAVGPG